jgi:hypothetical protein
MIVSEWLEKAKKKLEPFMNFDINSDEMKTLENDDDYLYETLQGLFDDTQFTLRADWDYD